MKGFINVLFLSCCCVIKAQDGKFDFGARNSGIGGASVTLSDEYSLFNNVSGMSKVASPAAFFGYRHRFNISAFQVTGGGFCFPFSLGFAGFGYYKFGDDLFSEQKVHVGFAHQIQLVSLGLGVDIVQYNISTVGTARAVVLQFGGIAEILPELVFGTHIYNLNQAKLNSETQDQLPTVMKAGLSYRPNKSLMLNTEIEKEPDFEEVFRFGIEYEVVKTVFLRTGISTSVSTNTFGVGFHPKKLKFDYSFSRNIDLGNIHDFSFSYLLKQ